MWWRGEQIRNPKSEIRRKHEIRNRTERARATYSSFGLRISDFGFSLSYREQQEREQRDENIDEVRPEAARLQRSHATRETENRPVQRPIDALLECLLDVA